MAGSTVAVCSPCVTADAAAALVAFITAAAALVILLFSLSLTIGLAQERTVRAIRARASRVKRWGGGILIGVGAWTILLAVFPDAFRPLLFP